MLAELMSLHSQAVCTTQRKYMLFFDSFASYSGTKKCLVIWLCMRWHSHSHPLPNTHHPMSRAPLSVKPHLRSKESFLYLSLLSPGGRGAAAEQWTELALRLGELVTLSVSLNFCFFMGIPSSLPLQGCHEDRDSRPESTKHSTQHIILFPGICPTCLFLLQSNQFKVWRLFIALNHAAQQ